MARKQPLNDDAPDLTDAELAEMRPAREVLTAAELETVRSVRQARLGRPPSEVRKVPVTIRLDPDIVDAFKATGDGWQSRMNAALRKAAQEIPRA
jgi:uncharacterized protein (DUF4415 family)